MDIIVISFERCSEGENEKMEGKQPDRHYVTFQALSLPEFVFDVPGDGTKEI